MKKLFFCSFIFLIITNSFSQGLKFASKDEIKTFNLFDSDSFGFSGDKLPSSYSLERYVPFVLDQGQTGTCVGFSTLYYGLSTTLNIKYGYTKQMEKYANSFDPYFIYSIMKMNQNGCEDGLIMADALDLIIKIGAKKLFYPPFLTCDSTWDEQKLKNVFEYTFPYKIDTWYYLETDNVNLIDNIKYYITNGSPIMFAAEVNNSLQSYSSKNINGVGSNGFWSPTSSKDDVSGHAMCIIGYDNYKYGGAFRVVNSWGKQYGDNGFLWIRYNDFKKYAREVYLFQFDDIDFNANPTINLENYTRFRFSNGEIYEGGKNSENNRDNYGINTIKSDGGKYYIGRWSDGYKEGVHTLLTSNKVYSLTYSRGRLIDSEALGFSGTGKKIEKEEKKKFFQMVNPDFELMELPDDLELEEIETPIELLETSAKKDTLVNK
jgi:C1A family cysteine protease